MVNKIHGISKFEARENMDAELDLKTNYDYAIGCLSDFMVSPGRGIPYFEGVYTCAAEGLDAVVDNDSVLRFPNELVECYGGVEDQYGYVEFDNPVGFDHIPFDEAYELIALTVKHYLAFRPDREARVTELMVQARKSFDRLQKNHDRWKRQNS